MSQQVTTILTVVDGVLIAALIELGKLVPAWSMYTTDGVMVIGIVGTLLGIPTATAAVRAMRTKK
jgi:hypothetical protein